MARAGIQAVCRIKLPVMPRERRLCGIEVPDIVLGGIFRTACIEQRQHRLFERHRIVPLLHQIVAVEDVAEEMPAIAHPHDLLREFGREVFVPFVVVPAQRDIERDDIGDRVPMERAIADGSAGAAKRCRKARSPSSFVHSK